MSLPIAYSMKKRSKRMAMGGDCYENGGPVAKPTGDTGKPPVTDPKEVEKMVPTTMSSAWDNIKREMGGSGSDGYAHGGEVREEEASGYERMPKDHEMHDEMAMHEDDRMLDQHGEMEEGPEGHDTMKEDEPHRMAHGGMMSPKHGDQSDAHGEDMVGRIMKKRQHMYAKGGDVEADFDSNDFDYMDKAKLPEFHDTGKNSGDELGNKYDADHDDVVSRIMMKRHKQRNPNPA